MPDMHTPTPAPMPPGLAHALANPARPDPLEALQHSIGILIRQPGRDLTARQLAVLLATHLVPGPHTVRGMAAALSVAKPAVTRALDCLGQHDLVRRAPDSTDRRSILAIPTVAGAAFLHRLAAHLRLAAEGR